MTTDFKLIIIGDAMRIDLSDEQIFIDNYLELDKPINFIFGKNGTGKSTITKLINEQIVDKDVRIYQGIKSVIANGKLNSVVLGEENVAAQKKIEAYEKEIVELEDSKLNFEAEKQDWKDKIISKNTEISRQSRKIKSFYSESAKKIKNNPLHIAVPSYQSPNFEKELKYAFHLSENEKNDCRKYLKTDEKIAKKISIRKNNFVEILETTNSLLESKVEEEQCVIRLDSDDKKKFAQTGIEIHERGEICSFCGNPIPDKVFDELETFFSVSKIKKFETSLENKIREIKQIRSEIKSITIKEDDFYLQFHDDIRNYKDELETIINEQDRFLTTLENALVSKFAQLFSASTLISTAILPKSSEDIILKYNNIVECNNSENLPWLKNFSRDLLRFDLIHTYVSKSDLNSQLKQLSLLKNEESQLIKKLSESENEIEKVEKQISEIHSKILIEMEKTRSEKKLANNINKKLKLYVPFQLEHVEAKQGNHQGYYRIKDVFSQNDEYRDVNSLSKGEKNIIGFLYFIEKLNEQTDSQLDKIIIFDDPMDSNDDMMQYIIVTEIQELMKQIDKNKRNDILIIMTHNVHFYINVKYNRLYKDGKDRNGAHKSGDKFIRLQKTDFKTKFKILDSEGQDFSTSYELLWKELRFLYEYDRPNLMLNSIRRIIETFTKFNKIDDFYKDNREAQKLFNVNSHSIDDLEADLNGKNKEQIVGLLKECFKSNGAERHYQLYWRSSNK
ncbi:AAA family ATPase [Streptococcus ruminicola]|uniref:AAA family ATPase n=2 Tax=Streptococcus ruminicola TaxID=2686210 RepID=A0A6G8HY92_9STRE|nr:AAA family ATPase [Streptococcus ruminicola]